MAHYLVKAKLTDRDGLRARLETGEIGRLRPFGGELQQVLSDARVQGDWVVWEENCFCSPPLRQERTVLDEFFTELKTTRVEKGAGWAQLDGLPGLWATADGA